MQPRVGGSKRERLQLPLIFFIELAALAMLGLAAGGPVSKLAAHSRPLIIILDDSYSMRAVLETGTPQEQARAFLRELLQTQRSPSTRIILAGKEPRITSEPIHTHSDLEYQLQRWQCNAPRAAIEEAIGLANAIGRGRANILVVTDHAPRDPKNLSDNVRWHAFGSPSINLGFSKATRSNCGDQDKCMLEIFNGSSTSQKTRLTIYAGSNTISSTSIELGPGKYHRVVFDIPASIPLVRAELAPDALADDNVVNLLPPLRKRVRVLIALTNSSLASFIDHALESTGLRATTSENPDLVIHQSPSFPVSKTTWTIRIIQPDTPIPYIGPYIIDPTHPLTEGLSLHGVIWAAQPTTNLTSEIPVILAGNVPLLSTYTDLFGRQRITLNFDPTLSTLQNTPNWPILFWNILHWRASYLPGPTENNVPLGSEVLINTAGEPIIVTYPDKSTKIFQSQTGQFSLETTIPGVYTVVIGQTTNQLAVNLLAPDESDLTQTQIGRWGKWSNGTDTLFTEASLVWVVGLLTLILLLAHLILVVTGKGVR